MKTEDLDKTAAAATTDDAPTSMEDFTKEMDAAVDEVVKEGKSDKEPELNEDGTPKVDEKVVDDDLNTDLPDGEALPDEKSTKVDEGVTDDETKQPVITDSHIERAIKAGMTIADAKSFANAESFDRVVSMLEAKNGGDDSSATEGEEDEKDVLESIPDLDPEEYDENIVNAFKSVKDILKQQLAVNAELRQRGTQNEDDWIDTQIQGLGEGFAEAVGSGAKSTLQSGSAQAAKRAEVERKFKTLEAGYKATGEDVSRESVFKEAVSLTLGDVAAQADAAKKKAALATRQKQMLNRANGTNLAPKKDAFDEAAEDIDRKYFGKH